MGAAVQLFARPRSCVPTLPSLLPACPSPLRKQIARTIGTLAAGATESRSSLLDAVPPLVRWLSIGKGTEAPLRPAAASALADIAQSHPEAARRIADKQVVAQLVHMLEAADGAPSTDAACVCLGTLAAGDAQNQLMVARAGAIPLLIDLLQRQATAGRTRAHACHAIARLTEIDENRGRVALAGGIPCLIRHLKPHDKSVAAVQLHAAVCVEQLARGGRYEQVPP